MRMSHAVRSPRHHPHHPHHLTPPHSHNMQQHAPSPSSPPLAADHTSHITPLRSLEPLVPHGTLHPLDTSFPHDSSRAVPPCTKHATLPPTNDVAAAAASSASAATSKFLPLASILDLSPSSMTTPVRSHSAEGALLSDEHDHELAHSHSHAHSHLHSHSHLHLHSHLHSHSHSSHAFARQAALYAPRWSCSVSSPLSPGATTPPLARPASVPEFAPHPSPPRPLSAALASTFARVSAAAASIAPSQTTTTVATIAATFTISSTPATPAMSPPSTPAIIARAASVSSLMSSSSSAAAAATVSSSAASTATSSPRSTTPRVYSAYSSTTSLPSLDSARSPSSRSRLPTAPTDWWYGIEDSDHVHRVLGEYTQTFKVREERQHGSRLPLEYVSSVERLPFGVDHHCKYAAAAAVAAAAAAAASAAPAAPSPRSTPSVESSSPTSSRCSSPRSAPATSSTFCTLDTLTVCLREPAPLGSAIGSERTLYAHTCWDAFDGFPTSIVALSSRQFECSRRRILSARARRLGGEMSSGESNVSTATRDVSSDESTCRMNEQLQHDQLLHEQQPQPCVPPSNAEPSTGSSASETQATYLLCTPSYAAERDGPFVYSSATQAPAAGERMRYQGLDQPCVMTFLRRFGRGTNDALDPECEDQGPADVGHAGDDSAGVVAAAVAGASTFDRADDDASGDDDASDESEDESDDDDDDDEDSDEDIIEELPTSSCGIDMDDCSSISNDDENDDEHDDDDDDDDDDDSDCDSASDCSDDSDADDEDDVSSSSSPRLLSRENQRQSLQSTTSERPQLRQMCQHGWS